MDITISDIKNISEKIREHIGININNFAQEALKSRINNINTTYDIRNIDTLISYIENGKITPDDFLHHFSVPFTEMFRDPSMWRKLKDDLISNSKDKYFKIFLPSCSTGDEYYSLLILLDEIGILNSSHITVSSWSKKTIATIKEAIIPAKKMEINVANYKRFEGKGNIESYFESNKIKNLQKNTEFLNISIFDSKMPINQDIIIFRNKFIYFTQDTQNIVLEKLHNSLKIGGKLIIGIKENIFLTESTNSKFAKICEEDRIYKKK
jgi:chemotaxis protein methyltransferase CheR